MAHHADPVTRTLTQKTNPMAAAAKMPIQFSPLLPVWMNPKSVEVTQAACQKPALSALTNAARSKAATPAERCVDAPYAVSPGAQHQVKAEPGDSGQRPPEVDAARERELQVAAEHAFFKASHQQKGDAPECGDT